jgi:hypothetical protein
VVHCCAVLVTIEYTEPSVIHICIVYTLIAAAAAAAAARLRMEAGTDQFTDSGRRLGSRTPDLEVGPQLSLPPQTAVSSTRKVKPRRKGQVASSCAIRTFVAFVAPIRAAVTLKSPRCRLRACA